MLRNYFTTALRNLARQLKAGVALVPRTKENLVAWIVLLEEALKPQLELGLVSM